MFDILSLVCGRVWRGVFLVAIALSCYVSSAMAQQPSRVEADFDLGRATEILVNMMREFDLNYVDKVSADKLLDAASAGMISATDPYSQYISEQAMAEFELMTTGKYGGVGSLIRKKDDYVIFAQPYKGSPSDEAGIRIGDKILAIEGESMKGVATDEISKRLKGDPGTDVSVVIERNIDHSVDTLRLTRRRISIPSVPYYGILRDSVGYICHNDFTEGCYQEMRHAVEELMREPGLRGIILDYRSNGGGVFQEAVDIVSLFVPNNERVVSLMGRDSTSLVHYTTQHQPVALDIPLVVLVNGSSASASEIVAGSLQDLDRAVVMGQRTYGKGLVQGTRHLGYNTYLKYTTAKYYIPSGRCIQALNYSECNSDGSVKAVPDSLLTEYHTRAGRKVYDGGGIVPDRKIEPQYVSRFALTLYAMGYMEDWADEYMRRHVGEKIDVRTFSITDEDYADFAAMIAERDVPYESETRRALRALEKAVEEDLYNQRLGEALEEMRGLIKDDKMSNMETYRREIVDALNTEIVLRHAYNSGAVEHGAMRDEDIDAAIDLLLQRNEYERILREQDVDRR